MRPGSASANGGRQTRIWHRTEVIAAAPPATVPRIAIIIITAGAGDPDPRQHHRSAGHWPRTPLFPPCCS
jgi:hypothetical protein